MDALAIEPRLIPQIYYWGVFIVCLFLYFNYSGSNNCDKLLQKNSMAPALLLTLVLIVFIGLRPVSHVFGDTVNYARGYRMPGAAAVFKLDMDSEWFFWFIENSCKAAGLSVNGWFFIIAIAYMGFAFWGIKLLLAENAWMGLLFFLSAFSTFTFGTNGIRNGMACSMTILAFAIAAHQNFSKLAIAGAVLVFAFGVHRSIALPVAAFIGASYFIKSPKWAIYFWLLSIIVSLVAGGAVSNFFAGLGFDDRMSQYGGGMDEFGDQFSQTGFRWDFLLYSAMPIWLTWYVTKKAETERALYGDTMEEQETNITGAGRIADAHSMRVFQILATTYILANSFWVMVIRAAFSNRFAYLSWFLYPIVIAYAVIRLHIWEDQDKKAGLILALHALFTIVMYLLGKL